MSQTQRRHKRPKFYVPKAPLTRSCGKVRFATKKHAQTRCNEINNRERRKHLLRIYECPYCGGWHLSHREEANNSSKIEGKHANK